MAWLLNGKPMISLRHVGDVPLEMVAPRYVVWLRVNRKNRFPHWVETTWNSQADCDRAIALMRETDKSIVSIESSNVPMES